MREILFRGKLADEGYWVEGGYIHLHKTTYCVAGEDDGSNDIHRIVFERMTDWNLPHHHLMGDVIPETVGQYTGLTDKNGVDIFEGDIVKIADFQIGQVVFECGAFGIAVMPNIDWDYLDSEIAEYTGCNNRPYFCRNDNFISLWEIMWNYNQEENYCYVVEVIGNIHDNPELLKTEGK